jgi:hypothetical protein
VSNPPKVIESGDGVMVLSKKEAGQLYRHVKRIKNIYDYSYFGRKNNKQKGTK